MGGGTGSFQLLAGLRDNDRLTLRSIVTMTDSGGDSGRLRDEFGVLPPGDIRRCLLALSEDSTLLRSLFEFRFQEDPLHDRQMGNLLFLALTRILGTERAALQAVHRLLKIRGQVLPVSWDHVHLCAELANGQIVEREANIDKPVHDPAIPIRRVFLKPAANPNPDALDAIVTSDFIVLAPGDLFTSTIPNLLVTDVPEALQSAPGKLVYVMNLMTKRGETDGYSASRHVEQIITYGGRVPDAVLGHVGPLSDDLTRRYQAESAQPVRLDHSELAALGIGHLRTADIMSPSSKARHDPGRTAVALDGLFTDLAA